MFVVDLGTTVARQPGTSAACDANHKRLFLHICEVFYLELSISPGSYDFDSDSSTRFFFHNHLVYKTYSYVCNVKMSLVWRDNFKLSLLDTIARFLLRYFFIFSLIKSLIFILSPCV